jgi:hypothetical protein
LPLLPLNLNLRPDPQNIPITGYHRDEPQDDFTEAAFLVCVLLVELVFSTGEKRNAVTFSAVAEEGFALFYGFGLLENVGVEVDAQDGAQVLFGFLFE